MSKKKSATIPAITEPICSFCGRDKSQVKWLVAGNNVAICDDCNEICQQIVFEGRIRKAAPYFKVVVDIPTVKEVVK